MKYYKKLLILFVVVVTIFILYTLFMQRQKILRSLRENMDDGTSSDQNSEFNSLVSKYTENESLSSFTFDDDTMQLKQYVIKASADSTLTGKYVNVNMIEFLLNRGVRFMDFSVFSFDQTPYVAYSTDSTGMNLDSRNKIPLAMVLRKINKITSEYTDPIFIHLRIFGHNTEIYNKIGNFISETFGYRLANGTINGNTSMKNLKKKIVIMVDKTSAPDYASSKELKEVVNSETGTYLIGISKALHLMNQTTPNLKVIENKTTNVSNMEIIYPDISVGLFEFDSNPDSTTLIKDYGCQFVCPHYHNRDDHLVEYEAHYNNSMAKTSFLPLADFL